MTFFKWIFWLYFLQLVRHLWSHRVACFMRSGLLCRALSVNKPQSWECPCVLTGGAAWGFSWKTWTRVCHMCWCVSWCSYEKRISYWQLSICCFQLGWGERRERERERGNFNAFMCFRCVPCGAFHFVKQSYATCLPQHL